MAENLVKRPQEKSEVAKETFVVDARIPSEAQIVENPRRAKFLGGGWVDSSEINVINLYWHRRREHFTIYSLLNVLEHETLHVVLAKRLNLEASKDLDNIHRSRCVWISEDKMVFINEFKCGAKWSLPPYFEEPTKDMLEA